VKVDIVYTRMSPRTKAIVDLITYLFVFLFCLVVVRYGIEVTWAHLINGYTSTSAWSPITWPFKIMVPIAGVLLGTQALAKWIRDLVTVLTGVKLESKVVRGEGGIRE
jgi:TRAP-type mannitol/chloroaromatic compound transport system permease small subunit